MADDASKDMPVAETADEEKIEDKEETFEDAEDTVQFDPRDEEDKAQDEHGVAENTTDDTSQSPESSIRDVKAESLEDVKLNEPPEHHLTLDATGEGPGVTDQDVLPENEPSLQSLRLEEAPISPPPKRKLFGWLSRNTSDPPQIKPSRAAPPPLPPRNSVGSMKSPPLPPRRDTISSSGTLEEEDILTAKRRHRYSLKDRFQLVRLREEGGVIPDEGGNASAAAKESADDVGEDSERPELALDTGERSRSGSQPPVSPGPTVNESLPPGTAAGISFGPSVEDTSQIDWDLWQEVVTEGPTAVSRTSQKELKEAIARGIPSAIRGVIWQVLANSKNEELESVYYDLKSRGDEVDSRRPSVKIRPTELGVPDSTSNLVSPSKVIKSESPSSRQSGRSTPQSGNHINGAALSPAPVQDSESLQALAQAQTRAVNDAEKRMKEEAKMLGKLEKAIRRDLGARTSYSKFLMSAGLQDGLFGICKAYALFDEDVGYAQGMNFIAMPLLFNMPEEEAFCLFVRMMNRYGLRDLFKQEMPGLHVHLYQFERLLEDKMPALYCHLHRRGVSPQLYATQWFLTLFAYRFPLQLVLRIYDLLLSEGVESAILKFGIVLMQKNAVELLEMKDMSVLTTFLKERIFDVYIDKSPSASSVLESGFFGSAGGIDRDVYRADALVQDACAVEIPPEMLKQYTSEWEEKVREEKERLAAAEALKQSNTALSLQVRSLEERIEKSDAEQVQVASDLVRTKVANEQLTEDNESLRTQIEELQRIIQAQPGEVEDRLRQEMDRIMTRNIEVQNENRALEESVAEMEQELSSTKIKHAEVSAKLDGMKQKWSSITTMMSSV